MSRISWVALFSLLAPLAATAQNSDTPDVFALDTIVISGGLSPIAANSYGRAFTVVTAEEMEQRGLRSVQDVLRRVPGVAVSSAGGSHTQVRIRGAEANHTLILIDGVPATGGNDEYILTGLETANIDRIEVLRGPQSVYYGSNASSGVINIITRKGDSGTHYGGSVEVGNGYAASGWFTQRSDRGGLAFTASKRDDHGFNQALNGHEKDGIDRRTIGLTGDWQATDDIAAGFTLRRAREKNDSDSTNYAATGPEDYLIDDPDQRSERNELVSSLWAEYAMLDGRMTHRLEFQDTVFKQGSNAYPETRGETRALKYRLSYGLDGQQVADAMQLLNIMVERSTDKNTMAPDYARANNSVAVEYRGFFDNGLNLQGGIRHDNFDSFDDFTSWNIGLSWQVPGSGYRLHASAGRGLVKPSYYELFANDIYTLGNPGLKPEQNTGFDLGLEAEILNGRGMIDVTYFNEKMVDEITFLSGIAADGSGRASYVNQPGKSPREGIEVAAQLQASQDLSLGLNYTYLEARNPDGSPEARRPRHELGLSATYSLLDGQGMLTADIRHVSGNFDTQNWGSYPTEKLPAYTVVNISGGYDINENVRATARILNLFDKSYMDVWGYGTQGRTAYVGLEAKW